MEIGNLKAEIDRIGALSNYQETGERCQGCGEPIRVYSGDDKSEEDPETGRILEYRNGQPAPCWQCERALDLLVDQVEFLAHFQIRLERREIMASTDYERAKIADDRKGLQAAQEKLNAGAQAAGVGIDYVVDLAREKYFRRRKRYG